MGRPRKPTAVKIAEGLPGKRKPSPNEPAPIIGEPRKPKHLGREAAEVWEEVVIELRDMGTLSVADGHALEIYCVAMAQWRECERFLAKNGLAYPLLDAAGKVKCLVQYPQVSMMKSLHTTIKGYQNDFGLTPAGRTRIETTGGTKNPAGRLLKFMERGRGAG